VGNPPEGAHLHLPAIDLSAASALPQTLQSAAQTVRDEAELILDHRLDLLGSGLVHLGAEIDWSRDFKSGYRWPLTFYQDLEVTRLTDASDAKVPWELSRSHHLLTLARAAVLFEDARYAEELERQLESWLAANPTGYGINWASPMEVALRAVNWAWAIATVEVWRPLDLPLRRRVTRSLQAHARHIAANLEGTPYLRSNHYLSDVLGLLVLGSLLKGDPEREKWFRLAQRALDTEICAQVHADGIGFEASLPYHAFALEIFLVAKIVCDKAGVELSPKYTERLRRMLEASRVLRHPTGRLPQFGDGDSGRVLPGSFERTPTLDHLLWLGAAVLGDGRPLPDEPHSEVAWTLGVDAWLRVADLPQAATPSAAAYPSGGFYVLRSNNTHAVVRCGGVGQNGNGGHAHNDLLSFELSCGAPVVVDAGTYAYTSDPVARNAFRATAAHNTVAVAGAEINPIAARELFRLRQVARPRVEVWEERTGHIRLVVSHDGYRRLEPSVVHRRTFVLERASGVLTIGDELLGRGDQWAETFLHLAPPTMVRRTAEAEFELATGGTVALLEYWGVSEVELVDGWVSDRFGVREEAPVLVACASGALPLRFGYQFVPWRSLRPGEDQPTAAETSR